MRFMTLSKDGGPESTVWAYTLIEIKCLFSVVLLRFEDGSRDAYHSHAFSAASWVLAGELHEDELLGAPGGVGFGSISRVHRPGWRAIRTLRRTFHKVVSFGRTWVLSFRGPWQPTWSEYIPATDATIRLTHGRVAA